LKAFKSSFPIQHGNHKNYERKVYNKFAYYLLVGGTIIDKVASSLSKWVANRSEVLQEKAKRSLETGYTRVELRFEHLQFESIEFYTQAIEEAVKDLV
jgi:L-alanine-DL-glutamate epimerase-like enolase superfamily enzyme